ncbi:uncharacterized protein [Parasteatoda tepidariorum]|uniref:uncharacterized protein n=1 Tax=Parasteatoda tepidariorum TaxID=114398 RepID=UPI0039BC7AF6
MSGEECFQSDTSICTFYLLSSCTKGRKCPFLHDIPNNIGPESSGRRDPCYFFLKGRCNDGESCLRSHSEPPSFNGTIKKVCLYFSQGRCDRGKLCSYNHDLPFYHSPVSIIVDSESSSCQPENINVVSPVVINTSDDVQSMAVTSKLCRFYLRGMCFFGENCTNFHDKPEKEPEDFISDLRENEVLNEKKALDGADSFEKSGMNLNLPVESTKNGEIYFNALEVVHGCSNLSNQHQSCKDTNSSSKSEELHNVPFDGSPKPNELFTVPHCRSAKSGEIIEDPCRSEKPTEINEGRDRSAKSFKIGEDHRKSKKSTDLTEKLCSTTKSIELTKQPSSFVKSADLTKDLYNSSISVETTKYPCSSSNWSEFSRTSNTSSNSKFLRDTSSKSNEFFRESNTSSKTKEFVKGTHFLSKSKEFARSTHSSNCKEFIKSKSKEYSRSKYNCSYSQSKKFSNSSHSFTKSKEFLRTQYSSKPKVLPSSRCVDNSIPTEHSKNADVSLKSEEFTRNSEILKRQSRNSSYPLKLEQCRKEANSINPIKQSKIPDDLKPIKAKEYSNIKNNPSNELSNAASSNSTSKTQVSLTGGFSKHTKPDKICHMTRKQSKSQRKLKSENTQSRIFFKRLFFRTPVPVTHVTKA